MTEECIHEMTRDTCSYCKDRPLGPTWAAKFEGVCTHPSCLKVIDVGESVTWDAEGTHVIHARHGQK